MIDKAFNSIENGYSTKDITIDVKDQPKVDISLRTKIIGNLFFNSRKIDTTVKTDYDNTLNNKNDNLDIDDISKRLLDRDIYKPGDFFTEQNFFYKNFHKNDDKQEFLAIEGRGERQEIIVPDKLKAFMPDNLPIRAIKDNNKDSSLSQMELQELIIKNTNQVRRVVAINPNTELVEEARSRFKGIFENKENALRVSVDWA